MKQKISRILLVVWMVGCTMSGKASEYSNPESEGEVSVSVQDSVEKVVKKSKLKGMIDFDPVDYLLPDRYVAQGDSFGTKWGTRLFVGVHTGTRLIVPEGCEVENYDANGLFRGLSFFAASCVEAYGNTYQL